MTDQQAIHALAQRLFDAVEAGDIDTVRACYTDDARIWHNTDGAEQTPDDNAAALRGFASVISDRRYLNRRLATFDNGFVQQHELHGTRGDGVRVTVPCCIVCEVRDGRISRLDEYFDSAHVAQFRKAAD
jgi:ketosteroid isomerase-like protein